MTEATQNEFDDQSEQQEKCDTCGEMFDYVNEDGVCEACDELSPPKEGEMCEFHEEIQAAYYLGGHAVCDDCHESGIGNPD